MYCLIMWFKNGILNMFAFLRTIEELLMNQKNSKRVHEIFLTWFIEKIIITIHEPELFIRVMFNERSHQVCLALWKAICVLRPRQE